MSEDGQRPGAGTLTSDATAHAARMRQKRIEEAANCLREDTAWCEAILQRVRDAAEAAIAASGESDDLYDDCERMKALTSAISVRELGRLIGLCTWSTSRGDGADMKGLRAMMSLLVGNWHLWQDEGEEFPAFELSLSAYRDALTSCDWKTGPAMAAMLHTKEQRAITLIEQIIYLKVSIYGLPTFEGRVDYGPEWT